MENLFDNAGKQIIISKEDGIHQKVYEYSVEDIYQAFKERIMDEIRVENATLLLKLKLTDVSEDT